MMLHRHFEAQRAEEKPEVKAEPVTEVAEKPVEKQPEEKPVARGRSKKTK